MKNLTEAEVLAIEAQMKDGEFQRQERIHELNKSFFYGKVVSKPLPKPELFDIHPSEHLDGSTLIFEEHKNKPTQE